MGADVIVTAAPGYEPLAALRGGERFPKGAHLLLIHEGNAEPLVAEFAASADASVSFDGEGVVLGQETGGRSVADMGTDAGRSTVRQVTTGSTDAIGRCICRDGGLFTRCGRERVSTAVGAVDGVEGDGRD